LKIIAALLTEGVSPGERGLDIKGLMTHLCAPLPQFIDFLHITVMVDLNPQDVGTIFPVEVLLKDPRGQTICESRTRTSFASGIQGAPSVVTFPVGAVLLDNHGPHMIEISIGSTSGSVAFNFQDA